MPNAIKRHRPAVLKPSFKTLASRNTQRTLALNGAAWRKLRKLVLTEQPLCPRCQERGQLVPALEVDHVDNDPTNNRRDNLMGLCRPHHSEKTNADRYGQQSRGCDVYGRPLTASHANGGKKSPATKAGEPISTRSAHSRNCGSQA